MNENFIKDIVSYLPARVVPAIIGFFSIPLITRIFSPQDYGNYCLVVATITVQTILIGWLSMSIIRFYPIYECNNKLSSFYPNIINLTLISILFLTLIDITILLLIKSLISSQLLLLMSVGVGVFVFTGIFNIYQSFIRIKMRISIYSRFEIWRSIGKLGIALLLIFFFRVGIVSLLWGSILSLAIVLPLSRKKVSSYKTPFKLKIDFFFTKEIAKYSLPLVVGNLASWIMSLSDRYILEIFKGSKEVGIYSASYNIADNSINLINTLFMLASGPILVYIWEKELAAKTKEFLNIITRYYLIICIPAVFGLTILSKIIMYFMTGKEYLEAYIIFPFITSGILLLGIQKIFNDGLLLCKKTNYIGIAILSSGLLNLTLNFLFIPQYGYYAAAVTTLISYAVLLFLMVVFSRRFFIWKFPFKTLSNVIFASVIMGIVVYNINNFFTSSYLIKLISGICIGTIVYFFILLIIKEFSKKEIHMFIMLKDKIVGK